MKRFFAFFVIACTAFAVEAAPAAKTAELPSPAKIVVPAVAEAPKIWRVCTHADLVGGTWKLIRLQETPKRRDAIAFQMLPFSYLTFYQEGRYSYANADREAKDRKMLDYMLSWPQRQQIATVYTLDKNGVLNLFHDKRELNSFRCMVATATEGEYVKNDLALTGYTRKKKSTLYKLYRRWL